MCELHTGQVMYIAAVLVLFVSQAAVLASQFLFLHQQSGEKKKKLYVGCVFAVDVQKRPWALLCWPI